MSVIEPRPNPETVEAVHDIAWRVAGVESARTEGLDRKGASLATFTSLLTSLTATLGFRFVESVSSWWALVLFLTALASLSSSVVMAVRALVPKEYVSLGLEYLERLPTWSVVLRSPEDARGEAVRGVIESIARERKTNDVKAGQIKWAFRLLLAGLALISVEAATLAATEVF